VTFTAAHALFGPDTADYLSARNSVNRRDVDGATGPHALQAQLEAARLALHPVREPARANEMPLEALA
jgi:hypothetical protein